MYNDAQSCSQRIFKFIALNFQDIFISILKDSGT